VKTPTPMRTPIVVGLLFDFPQPDEGASFEADIRLGLDDVVALRGSSVDVELRREHARGLPSGTPEDLAAGLHALDKGGAAIVVGPSISDNGVIARDLADAAGLACVNYTGGERCRSEWMFQYQVGSLEEEPPVLARRLFERDLHRVALVHDDSIVGHRYRECFGWAAASLGLDIAATRAIGPLTDDAEGVVTELREAEPSALVYLGLGASSRAVALGMLAAGWSIPVVANSALMFGYAKPDWRDAWAGWEYLDGIADDNAVRRALREKSPRTAAGPIGCAAYDIGRLVGEAITRADATDRAGLKEGLERVKQVPAASGVDGTTMGFGAWDRAALKGRYLVLREWRDRKSVQVTT
jgi:branched-chain amino acid transport system substrate-binding protein